MEVHPGLIFFVLVVVVPLQYYLSPSSSSDMKYYVQRLTDSIIQFTERFGVHLPFVSLRYDVKRVSDAAPDGDDGVSENDRADSASYGSSLRVRERAPHVQWRVGQVIKHKWPVSFSVTPDFVPFIMLQENGPSYLWTACISLKSIANPSPENYRSVSITSLFCGLFEKVLKNHINRHLDYIISSYQHRFVSGGSV
ncbi:hypothetical protein COOONC_00115 [Cooperia oncophora]